MNASANGWSESANWKRNVSSAESGMNAIEGVEAPMNVNGAAINVRQLLASERIGRPMNAPHLLPRFILRPLLLTSHLLPMPLPLLRSLIVSLESVPIRMKMTAKGVREKHAKRLLSREAVMSDHGTTWRTKAAEAVSAEQTRGSKRLRLTLTRSTVDVSSKRQNGAALAATVTVILTGSEIAGDEERRGRSLASVQKINVPANPDLMLSNQHIRAMTSALPAF